MVDPQRSDHQHFRRVLGNYPTGVTVVTAIAEDGRPAGLAVGSFTSVSLDPPLIAFLPDKQSSSFPKIRTATSFCVNILSADQEHVCRAFAAKGTDKFAGIDWRPAPSGAPLIDGVVGWIDCDFESVQEAGDHYLVIGRVRELDASSPGPPLVFFQGGYGRFAPFSLIAVPEEDFIGHLRIADAARGEMERLATELGTECTAVAAVEDQLVVLASAGPSATTRVGKRIPFVAPTGALFVAWAEQPAIDGWLTRSGCPVGGNDHTAHLELLDRVRARGWSIEAVPQEHGRPDHGLISAPVSGQDGTVQMTLSLWGLTAHSPGDVVSRYAERLCDAARSVSEAVVSSVR